MGNLLWLNDTQIARLRPFFAKSHGRPCVDDIRVLSGVVFINRNCLRWCDAPKEYGPSKTLYNHWKRWSDKGVSARMMEGLASLAAPPNALTALLRRRGKLKDDGERSAIADNILDRDFQADRPNQK